ncbi:kinase-like domain-containing protein [Lipomyces japonicus]|uniref:kinase-like domain-containing protein n=1 Tax=Lipomyces japonicus TaxID=56871 RepID=UPI0034CEBDC6
METFSKSFKSLGSRFRLINKIGEGTFSSVYKAEDLEYDNYEDRWDLDRTPEKKRKLVDLETNLVHPVKKRKDIKHTKIYHRSRKLVAIKRIYVTSSPQRILNELELLHDLSGCTSIAPLITAFRDLDQVVAILPYCDHLDFRDFYRIMSISEMRHYMKNLFTGLEHVHKLHILHRDIKPTNFLYHPAKRRGVLVDFGLAEREYLDPSYCVCREDKEPDHVRRAAERPSVGGYMKNDTRPGRRANRAGTRGFRAPEVLFKCLNQTTKIDVWSAGVILLSFLSRRFPFFNSSDDIDAMIEIATLLGKHKMIKCARQHGAALEITIPSVFDEGWGFEEICNWLSGTNDAAYSDTEFTDEEILAYDFLRKCMDVDFQTRMSASDALKHPFLADL